jgi:hypothetical protein
MCLLQSLFFCFAETKHAVLISWIQIVIIINKGIYSEGEFGRDEGKMKFGKQFKQQKVDCCLDGL